MVTGWIFGKVADGGLKKLRGMSSFNGLESGLLAATKQWGKDISGEVVVDTQHFFDPNSDPTNGEDCPRRLKIRKMFKAYKPPSTELWHDALMENWDIVNKRFGDGETQPIYKLERGKASGYLQRLAEVLNIVCVKDEEFFKVNITDKVTRTEKTATRTEKAVTKIDKKLDKVIERRKDDPGREVKGVHNLPFGSLGSFLKGRGDALKRLGEILASDKPAAITQVGTVCGLGGIGKTRLAIEFAWEGLKEERFSQAYFVGCGMDDKSLRLFGEEKDEGEIAEKKVKTAQGRFTAAIAELAGEGAMGLGMSEHTQSEKAHAVLGRLQQREGWVLILDNVDERAMQECVRKLLPQLGKGKVIVTSRIKEWRKEEAEAILIEKLTQGDSKAYMLERTEERRAKSEDDDALANRIAEELDGLPMALEQAAGYINRKRVGFAKYIEEFERHREEVLGFADGGVWVDYPKPVLTTWQTTVEQFGEVAKWLFELMAFLGPEAIPADLFTGLDELAKAEGKETPGVHAGLVELADWSMIKYEDGQVTVHRLIQEVTRLRMEGDECGQLCEMTANMVDDHMPSDPPPSDVRSWEYWEVMAGHVEMVAGYADEQGIAEPTTRLMNELGQFLDAQGRYDEAEPLMRRALEIDEASYGSDHPDVAIRLNNLAQLLGATNRLDEAEPLMRRALEINEASYGSDHPKVAIHLNNLAILLRATNRLDEAEPLMERVIEIFKKSYGKEHPNVAIALNNLAGLLQATDRLDEAEPMYRRAIEIGEASYGPDHPDVAIDLNNLAGLFKATNRLDEAEPLMRRVIEILLEFTRRTGHQHPHLDDAIGNYGGLLMKMGKSKEEAVARLKGMMKGK